MWKTCHINKKDREGTSMRWHHAIKRERCRVWSTTACDDATMKWESRDCINECTRAHIHGRIGRDRCEVRGVNLVREERFNARGARENAIDN